MDNRNNGHLYRDLRQSLDAVYLRKALTDRSLLEKHEAGSPAMLGDGSGSDYEFEVIIEGLFGLSEAVWGNYSEEREVETMYFSHPDIVEYYRLCREYGREKRIPLRANPYVLGAARFVDSQLGQHSYVSSYYLQTKVGHKWASGVVFRMWPEFDGHLALLVLVRKIFEFYTRELARLKAELAVLKTGPESPERKEAA
jgi:hypothetical protein